MRYWQQGSLARKIAMGLVHAEGEGGGQGNEDRAWVETLPESVQGWDEVKNSDSADKFWDQMANQRSRMGRSITIPGEDAGEEDVKAFHKKLTDKVPGLMPAVDPSDEEAMGRLYDSMGRPEAADKYEMPEVKVDGYEGEIDLSAAEQFREVAHKAGLSGTQFQNIVTAITTLNVQAQQDAVAANVEAHKELKKEWGADYDRRMSLATNIAKLTDAPEGLYEMLKEGRGTPADYQWLYSLALKFKGEGKNLQDDQNDAKAAMTPAEAQEKIDEIRNNKKHPYWNKMDPGHKRAMDRMKELYKIREAGKG